jgi:hypothetical protein
MRVYDTRPKRGRNPMESRLTRRMRALSFLLVGIAVFAGDAIGQQKSLTDQLVGTWIYVSSTRTAADGTKNADSHLKGIVIYTSDGHFAFVTARDDLPKLANPDRTRATPDEATAILIGAIAYYGTYVVNEREKVITANVEGGTYPNLIGTDQKRIITSLTADELRFTNPRTPAGVTLEFVWKRAR